jgi:hypothetical protein
VTLSADLAYIAKKFPDGPRAERDIQWSIRYVLGRRPDVVLFRNQTGKTEELGLSKKWVEAVYRELCTGSVSKARTMVRDVVHAKGRWITYGLGVGSSDLVGCVSPGGNFLAIEVKTATGRASVEQLGWIQLIEKFGGVAGIARSVQDALVLYRKAGGAE